MCNINLCMRKDKRNDKKLSEYMNFASFNSWNDRNNDGEGCVYFGSNRTMYAKRSLNKLRYDDIKNVWFLCSHQRLATIGDGKQNAHPHTSKDFICFHNGIFSGLGNKNQSDTRVYLDKLQKNFNKCGDIEKALNKTHDTVNGSYSVVLVHKRTRDVFYYKNFSTWLYYIENSKYLIMSTLKENVEYAKFHFGIKNEIKEAKDSLIYELVNNDFKPVGQILSETVINKSYPRTKNCYGYMNDYFDDVEHYDRDGYTDTGFKTWQDDKKKELVCNRLDTHEEEL